MIDDDELLPGLPLDRVLQRFALAAFYYETTNGGKLRWKECNPVDEGENIVCKTGSSHTAWLATGDECKWFGVDCKKDSWEVIGLQLRK